MRVLVTGAGGFLGGHVARHLVGLGFEVTGFDLRVGDGTDFVWVQGDLTAADEVAGAARGHDVICHLGAIGDVYQAAQAPALAATVNVAGSANVAQAALRAEARVVYASTWEVYGRPEYEPIDEEHPCRPDHPYNITKLAGEQMLMATSRLEGLPVTSLRIGTAYGPGLRANSVFRLFIDRARRGEPIVIQGDGAQTRQFTHAKDIAQAFALACGAPSGSSVLNVLSGELVSIKQLAELVAAHHPTEIVFGDARAGDIPSATVSSARIRQLLGWEAKIAFADGLDELITQHSI